MTLHVLDVAPRDVSAAELGLLLDAGPPAPLAELVLRSGEDCLALAVLGCSSAVTATARGRQVVEQISCGAVAAGGEPLPAQRTRGGYAIRSSTRCLPAAELTALAERLRATSAATPGWLCGAFPGARAAVTALTGRALAAGWTWQTWHLYPGAPNGAVVHTRSRWTP